jgi:hypothetical protein
MTLNRVNLKGVNAVSMLMAVAGISSYFSVMDKVAAKTPRTPKFNPVRQVLHNSSYQGTYESEAAKNAKQFRAFAYARKSEMNKLK